MEVLKNRRTAVMAMCVMILLGVLTGAYTSGRRLYSRVEELFYNGEKGNGVGVASDLSARTSAAVNMTTVALRYISPDDDLIKSIDDACAEAYSAAGLSEKKHADEYLAKAFIALYDGMGQLTLSEKDEQYRRSLYAEFTSYGSTMSHDGYNQAAAEYNRELSAFPGRLFFGLMGFKQAPVFR